MSEAGLRGWGDLQDSFLESLRMSEAGFAGLED